MRDYLRQLSATGGLGGPALVALAVLSLTAFAFFRVALLPEFGAELGMSTFQLGAVTTIFAVGRLGADLPGGHLADRFPARGILAISAGAVAAGSLMVGLSVGVVTLYAASLLLGIASSTTNATGMTYFSNVAGAGYRGTSMAVFSAALLGGQALGPTAAGLVASVGGWRVAMYVAAGAAGLVALALGFTGGRPAAGGSSGPVDRLQETEESAMSRGAMVVLQSVSFAVFLTLGSIPQTLVPVVGSDILGLGAASIGLALGLGGVSRFVGTLIGGRLSDRVSRKAALVPALVVQGMGVGLLALPPSIALWLAAIVVMSIASYAVAVAATIIGDLAHPARVGRHLGRFRFAGDVGLILGPISVSAIYESLSRQAAFLVVAAVLVGVGLLCLRLLPETQPSSGS
ncbi:MAG: MFS transporter [Actinomycetota bacterium]